MCVQDKQYLGASLIQLDLELDLGKNWWHWTVFLDPCPDFATPRTSSRVVFRHRNAGPKMGPFSEPSVIVPILEGSRNGSGFRAHFWSRFSPFLNASFRKKWLLAGVAVTITIFHSFSLVFAANMTA